MAIKDTYNAFILEGIIRDLLLQGEAPSFSNINAKFNDFTAENDLSQPLFNAEDYTVERYEPASAKKFNDTFGDIERDLKVLYRHLFTVSEEAMDRYERWRAEGKFLETRLDALLSRIDSLLLVASDTAGYFNFMQDTFSDNTKVDLSLTTASVDVAKGVVTIGTSNTGATRHLLNDLRDKDIEFAVLSQQNLASTVSSLGSRTQYVVSDATNYWQETVYTTKPAPVSVELKINFGKVVDISRIDVDLHMSNASNPVQLTPMYSTDNYSYKQLPISNPTRTVKDKSSFAFKSVKARYVKLIMTKISFDFLSRGLYGYEFGVDEVAFMSESFDSSSTAESVFVSKPLFVNGTDKTPEEFTRLVLEACEVVPDKTSIQYFVSVSDTEDVPTSSGSFIALDPVERTISLNPTLITLGSVDDVTVSGIQISYNRTEENKFVSPAKTFTFLESVSTTTPITISGESSAPRYALKSSNDRILDLTVASGVDISRGTMQLWRNVNQRGQGVEVRGYESGWGFEDPYYVTTVQVDNPAGTTVDFGGKAVIIDEVSKTGSVTLAKGHHSVKVHRNNWKAIDATQANSLAELKAEDTLYPYNHRYLVEGLNYPSGWPTEEPKVYLGFDIVGEYLMKEVSPHDLVNSVLSTDYSKFGIDKDAEDTAGTLAGSTKTKESARVFVVKVDESQSDFVNEEFLLRFRTNPKKYKYLRLKAILKTTDSSVAPLFDAYRIKISH